MLVYATPSDLLAWMGLDTPDTGEEALLRSASMLVRRDTRTALYDTTPAGLPSDPDVAEAMRDATCAQVAAWVRLGIDPSTGPAGVTGQVQASSIGSGSVTRAPRAGADQDQVDTLANLVPDARGILDGAGLLTGQPAISW